MAEKTLIMVGILFTLCLCWLTPIAHAQVTDAQEVNELLAIRNKLEDPSKRLNWTRKHDPCTSNWTGVICSQAKSDGYMHIQELLLLHLNLSGTLAPELGLLPYMIRLDFMWNYIVGSIPKEIGSITALELLYVECSYILLTILSSFFCCSANEIPKCRT
ncbi:hypothetical protein ACS0TY_007618 [Phlomoides rotata]